MDFKNKNILVTGGSGFIGSHLCDEIIKDSPKKLIIFDNLCQSSKDNIKHLLSNDNVLFIHGDVRDYNVVAKLVEQSDFVFHLAASNVGTSIERPLVDLQTNIIGTFNVLHAALNNPKVRIVHVSSGSVLGSSWKPMDEEHPTNPSNMYGISKLAGEKYCKFFAKELGIKVSIIRYFHVFGPRQDFRGKSGVINIFLNRILNKKSPIIWGSGKQIQCFTYVQDVINATLLLTKNKKTIGEVYNVSSDNRINIRQLADILIKKYSKDPNMKIKYGPPKIGENMRPIPDVNKIKKLGWKTKYTFDEGLEKTYNWLINLR